MKNFIKNSIKHLRTITKHRYWVFRYCCMARIPIQGLFHDLSKFSPREFIESVKYYTGTDSPINACKKANGVSYAWLHHKGRNPHHYEYWQDNFDNGGNPIKMPYKYAVEMLCDYIGAGRAYQGKSFTYKNEFKWWISKIKNKNIAMHEDNIKFITLALFLLARVNEKVVLDRISLEDLYYNAFKDTKLDDLYEATIKEMFKS